MTRSASNSIIRLHVYDSKAFPESFHRFPLLFICASFSANFSPFVSYANGFFTTPRQALPPSLAFFEAAWNRSLGHCGARRLSDFTSRLNARSWQRVDRKLRNAFAAERRIFIENLILWPGSSYQSVRHRPADNLLFKF